MTARAKRLSNACWVPLASVLGRYTRCVFTSFSSRAAALASCVQALSATGPDVGAWLLDFRRFLALGGCSTPQPSANSIASRSGTARAMKTLKSALTGSF